MHMVQSEQGVVTALWNSVKIIGGRMHRRKAREFGQVNGSRKEEKHIAQGVEDEEELVFYRQCAGVQRCERERSDFNLVWSTARWDSRSLESRRVL